jgi:gluconolactonase
MDDFEIIDRRFKEFVLPNAPLEMLASGFRWLEGPVWFADLKCLLFSDIPNDRVMRWTETGGVEVFRQPSNFENGHTRDRQGRLISCSHRGRGVTRTEIDGTLTVLATHFQGKRLNSPNDVVVKSDGTIWFTDPHYGIQTDYEGGKQEAELPANVYRLDPGTGELTVVADDFQGPNGLCFSPDEQRLYIAETGLQFDTDPVQHIRRFDLSTDGARLVNGRVFHTVQPGCADGFRCDEEGNLWSSAGDGVHCINPAGVLLGKIKVPSLVANLTFGGRYRSRLFICASQTLYAIYVNRRGAQYP